VASSSTRLHVLPFSDDTMAQSRDSPRRRSHVKQVAGLHVSGSTVSSHAGLAPEALHNASKTKLCDSRDRLNRNPFPAR